jgi:hypothetical protein
MFGPFPANAATRACRTVNQIAEFIPNEQLEKLLAKKSHVVVDDSTEFGKAIKFLHWKPDNGDAYDWLNVDSGMEEDAVNAEFDMKYSVQGAATSPSEEKINGNWLRKKVEQAYGGNETGIGMTIADVCSHIFDVLSSSKSDEELQNEV